MATKINLGPVWQKFCFKLRVLTMRREMVYLAVKRFLIKMDFLSTQPRISDSFQMKFIEMITEVIIPVILASGNMPCRNSIMTGKMYYEELMHEDCNPRRFLGVAKMHRETFCLLLERLESNRLSRTIHIQGWLDKIVLQRNTKRRF